MKNKDILVWIVIGYMLHMSCIQASRFSVLKNLQPLISKLGKGYCKKAILFSPSFTNTAPLVEAADHGTRIMLVSRDKCFQKELEHPNISCRYAQVHDKLYLVQADSQLSRWSCYFGSANFSHRGIEKNRELVIHIEDALRISGLARHAQTIIRNSMIPENLFDPGNLVDLDFSELGDISVGQQLADLERLNNGHSLSVTAPVIISSFQTDDIVEHLAKNIQTNHNTHRYLISTMTLNHPTAIKRILATALLCDSDVRLLVDKQWAKKKLKSDNEFTCLLEKSRQSLNKIQIRTASKSTVPGYHHAKLLIREPVAPNKSTGLSIVSSANLTHQAKRDSNCVLEIPHTDTEKETTQALKQNFEDWWQHSEEIALS